MEETVFVRRTELLIVPYGIETSRYSLTRTGSRLLIVPYGIETTKCSTSRTDYNLLIVPYGIETGEGDGL